MDIEFSNRIYNLQLEHNALRNRVERLSHTIEGLHGSGGLEDMVREISVTLVNLEKMMKLITYLAVPLAVVSLFISFGAVIVSVIAINSLP